MLRVDDRAGEARRASLIDHPVARFNGRASNDLHPRSKRSAVRDAHSSRTENPRLHVLAERQFGNELLSWEIWGAIDHKRMEVIGNTETRNKG